ncbi:MAG TPA: hypothetical protein VGJ05_04665 [Fimbriiglobus sp.]|jgi:hypothetical protein
MKKPITATLLLASALTFIVFVSIALGVWFVSAELNRRADQVFGRASTALDRAQSIAVAIGEAIDSAEAELKAGRASPGPPDKIPTVQKALLRSALKDAPVRVKTAEKSVRMLGDLMVVANAALNSVQDIPGLPAKGAAALPDLQQKLSQSAQSLTKAEAILNTTTGRKDDAIAADDSREIEHALAETRRVVGDVTGKLTMLREEVETYRVQFPRAVRFATWSIAILSFFGAIGQIALVRWCVSIFRGSGTV